MDDLLGGGGVGGVQDLAHQQGFDGLPHHPGHGVGVHAPHEVVTEGSWGGRHRCMMGSQRARYLEKNRDKKPILNAGTLEYCQQGLSRN